MRIDIQTSGLEKTDGLREHVLRRLQFALDWARYQVDRVYVQLTDINGPRGGEDKQCKIRIPLRHRREVVISNTEINLIIAIDRAADRIGQTLKRQLHRQRTASVGRTHKSIRLMNKNEIVSAG